MTITQEADRTYSFSFGGLRWDKFPTLAAAQEALYDVQHGRVPDMACLTRPVTAPTVAYERQHLTDGNPGNGWDEFSAGGWILAVENGTLMLWSEDSELGEFEPADLAALRALLNDERVAAALGV